MADKWYFTKEELSQSPSVRAGISAQNEQEYKQQAAYLINDMGQRLKVSQSCIITATVYMHRFYAYHSQSIFKKGSVSCAALFLAAIMKETPERPESVIKTMHLCMNRNSTNIDIHSEEFQEEVDELLSNQFILLTTLGFGTEIELPHDYVFEFCKKLNVVKEFSRLADKIATHCLQLTSMCLRYRPKDIAVFCVHLTARWSHSKIQETVDGKSWLQRLRSKVTDQLLWKMEKEFKTILEMCSSRIQTRIMNLFSENNSVSPGSNQSETPEKYLKSENSVQRSKISFQDYIVRKKWQNVSNTYNNNNDSNNSCDNNNNNNNNNDNKTSKIVLDLSIKSVPISFETGNTISENSRKRKNSSDLNNTSSAKKFKQSWKIYY